MPLRTRLRRESARRARASARPKYVSISVVWCASLASIPTMILGDSRRGTAWIARYADVPAV